jgi:hypothetical protein
MAWTRSARKRRRGASKSGRPERFKQRDSDVNQFWVAKHTGYPWNFAV